MKFIMISIQIPSYARGVQAISFSVVQEMSANGTILAQVLLTY